MQNRRLDVLEILEKEKEYYLEQINRINIALSALKGELTQNVVENTKKRVKKSRVQWKAEIEKLFELKDILTIDEIQQQLIEKGIVEAQSASGKSSISTTLTRKVGENGFTKIKAGTYGYIKKENEDTNNPENDEFNQI